MPNELKHEPDIRSLVRWLGEDGAKAGLMKSKVMTTASLREIGNALGIKLPEKSTRATLIDEVVRVAGRRVEKPLDVLLGMAYEELVHYFEEVEVQPPELLDLLKQLDLSPRRESRRSLVELAARELSETGRFQRIAGGNETDGNRDH